MRIHPHGSTFFQGGARGKTLTNIEPRKDVPTYEGTRGSTCGQNIFTVATAQECDFPLVKVEAAFPLLRLGGITMRTALMPGEAGLAGVAAPEAKLCNRMASWSIIAGHWSNQVQLRYQLETTLGRCGHNSNLFNALHEVIPKGPPCIETNNKS